MKHRRLITADETDRILKLSTILTSNTHIKLHKTTDKRSEIFEKYCEELISIAPRIRLHRETGEAIALPAICIDANVKYHALPRGTELNPFLEALSGLDKSSIKFPESVREELKRMVRPSELHVFISPECPHCPQMVRQAIHLANLNECLSVSVIDCELFPEIAEDKKIQTVPTLIMNKDYRWSGWVSPQELIQVLSNQDLTQFGVAFFERMIEEGNASQIASIMLKNNIMLPAFIDVLTHSALPIRLGAMVAMEEIVENNPEIAQEAIGPLWKRFQQVEDPVKGDIIYILGELKSNQVVPRLKEILNCNPNREIIEAAMEALEKLRS